MFERLLGASVFRNVSYLSIAQLFSKVAVFVVIPFQLSSMGLERFGFLELILVSSNVVVPIVTLNTLESVFQGNYGDRDCFSLVILPPFIAVGILGVGIFFIQYFFEWRGGNTSIFLFYLSLVFVESLKRFVKAKGYLKVLMYAELFYSLLFLALTMGLFVAGELRLESQLYVYSISNIVFVVVLLLMLRRGLVKSEFFYVLSWRIHLSFSFPLLPNTILLWVSNFFDRFLVLGVLGAESLGVYSLIIKSVSPYKIFSSSVYDGIKTALFKEKDVKQAFRRCYIVNFKLSLLLAVICFVAQNFLQVYFIGELRLSYILIGAVLIVSYFGFSISANFGLIYLHNQRTRDSVKSTVVSCSLNVAFGVFLVTLLGLAGVALATLISAAALVFIRYRYSREHAYL